MANLFPRSIFSPVLVGGKKIDPEDKVAWQLVRRTLCHIWTLRFMSFEESKQTNLVEIVTFSSLPFLPGKLYSILFIYSVWELLVEGFWYPCCILLIYFLHFCLWQGEEKILQCVNIPWKDHSPIHIKCRRHLKNVQQCFIRYKETRWSRVLYTRCWSIVLIMVKRVIWLLTKEHNISYT